MLGTNQACLFRDNYTIFTENGFAVYGLSKDSLKSNSTFRAKQDLPYDLLCDQEGTLISAMGMAKKPDGTTRGVLAVDKSGKVLALTSGVNMQPNLF